MNKNIKLLILAIIVLAFNACNDDEQLENDDYQAASIENLSQWESGSEILMQAFFWDVPDGGNWWKFIENEVDDWAKVGVNKVWIPQFAKSASGGYSMGYDVADYFDLGEFNQYGSVETRFGSKAELLSLIETIHENNMEVIADIVINHNGGGAAETSGRDNQEYYTLFTPEAGTNLSGRFNRNWECFKPNDESFLFYSDKNLDLNNEFVQAELWKNENSVAKYYKNELGIDGWRFDYVKGYAPEITKAWNDATGNPFSVGENWDGNPDVLETWVNKSASKAFDFASFYHVEKAFDSQRDLNYLLQEGLLHRNMDMAVGFMANHDTDDRDAAADGFIAAQFKNLAYAYMLTHFNYSTLFYSDYEEKLNKAEINKLIAINKSIACGELDVLFANKHEYVARRNGNENNPGLIVYFNISSGAKSKTIQTNWNDGEPIVDYTNNSDKYMNAEVLVGKDGFATITVAPNSYAVWSVVNY
ncbi:MAG: alpha-amylase domain-containing protein [Mangrovibacterium sp.]